MLQGCLEAGHSQISAAQSGSEQWAVSCAGQRGGDVVGVQHPTLPAVPAHTPCALRGWQQAVGRRVLIQSLQGGLCFFLPLLK